MDTNNCRAPQLQAEPQLPPIDVGDWRSQLQPDSRERIVNKIMETLKRHLPFSGEEGIQELKQIAIKFEDNIYSSATSQSDYLRKISLKMLTMESKSQNELPGDMPSNSASINSQDLELKLMDTNNCRVPQAEPQLPPIDVGDWRSQLQPDSRERIVNKIMETLKRHLPFSGQEGIQELKRIAIKFEDQIYSSATSQSDYLRKISLKMITMESKSQNVLPGDVPPSNSTGIKS
ncbi:uncharacterized protein LOC141647219 [Silene latifolia]|uniref:uncharacterized protein LOC141647219 n=1 Tax=Silene latifolia TaxID=37657 RepID=UPI003D76E4F5